MTPTDEERAKLADSSSDGDLWRRSCLTLAPEDDPNRLLDLAAFADGLLEPDDHDRIAWLLARDPTAMEDVAAARMPQDAVPPGSLDRIVARACAILRTEPQSRVVAFAAPPGRRRILHSMTQWGSLAAAIAFASWLGFAMGSDASRTLSGRVPSNDTGFLPELFEPGGGFLRDLGEVLRT
jgi:hypothetical protein